MSVEELPDLNPPDFGNVRDPARPILSFAWQTDGAHRASAHSHARAHIIEARAGAFWVSSEEGSWLVPAGQAVWVPPRVFHEVYSQAGVEARVLFVDESFAEPLSKRCGTVKVNRLLAELIERTVDYGNDYSWDSPAARLAQVTLDELAIMEPASLLLPIAKEPRLARIMAQLIEEPGQWDSLSDFAKSAGASPRTVAGCSARRPA